MQQTYIALGSKASNTQSALQKAKQDNKILLELVDTLIAHANNASDTAAKIADCDTLQSTVRELMIAGQQKDSLYEDLTTLLQRQVGNKDSTINVQQQQCNSLKLFFDKSLAQQDVLSGQNQHYQLQVKQVKVKNKLLSASVLILTGVATYGLLHH